MTICRDCDSILEFDVCWNCGGCGEVNLDDPINGPEWHVCPVCHGEGEILYCPFCDEE